MERLEILQPSRSELSFVEPTAAESRKFDGPLSGPMSEKVRSLNSAMPDDFNWSVYDGLYYKFGDNQPRGGVVFKSGLKLANHHSSCTKCHYAFEIDTYGRGCIHNCHYCYAKIQLSSHGYWNVPHPFPIDISEVRKIFYVVFETDRPSKWRQILRSRVPIRIGSMSDSFMRMDIKYGVTRELLKILSFYNYPYIIFTRSDLIAEAPYLDLLRKDLCSIQFSICGNNEKLTRLIEPGAPSVIKRLTALKELNKAGFWTTVRINPFFPMYPDGYYTNPEMVREKFGSIELAPKFELFDWEMLDQIKDAGTKSYLAGVVRLSPRAVNQIVKVTGFDLKSFFDLRPGAQNGDLRYSDREVAHYYKQFQQEGWKRGLRFNTCYIGMGQKDYYQYQNLWSNKDDCCDAKGNVNAFLRSSQSIPWSERLKHATCKESALKAKATDLEMDQFTPQGQTPSFTKASIDAQV